jgi:diguanylate cyclase (GGDEF)-like protein
METPSAHPDTPRTGLLSRLVAWLDSQPRTQLFASSGIMVAALAGLSSAIGSEIATVVFYLAPISIAAYFVGRWQGRLVALLSAVAWTLMEEALRPVDTPLAVALASGFNRAVLFLVVSELLSSLRDAFNHERQLARTDELTGLANSRAFGELAEFELLRSRRYGRALSILYIDLDGFKAINDTLGHAAGDVVLQRAAAALREGLRRTDIVARLGGDEFVVLLPETGTEQADIVIGKVQTALGRALQGLGSGTTASIGAVTADVVPTTVQTLVDRADKLTYASKGKGKNQVTHDTVTNWAA